MGDVAARAGVSKALVHYHFDDKSSLLSALVDDVGASVVERGRAAADAAGEEHALDAYWTWLERELAIGDVRVLVSLGESDNDRVRDAARRVAEQRREITRAHVTTVYERLGLKPRVPSELIADTVVAFVDGVAIMHALEPERDARPAFDVLWLALLTLAE
jgi:AcrR family transcriptional regulator